MQFGTIRRLQWANATRESFAPGLPTFVRTFGTDVTFPFAQQTPTLDPKPQSAEEEAVALLRIAAEIEGALMVQYLFAAGSLLANVTANVPGFPQPIRSNDWASAIVTIAKQEMGHLITVQNLLLSLGADLHVDRENFPLTSPLYPFPFSLRPLSPTTLAQYVCAEAPHQVGDVDRADYLDAVQKAGAVVGEVPRAGQIYERLFWLFQDSDIAQEPWPDLQNPFPSWDNWHVDASKVVQNQDRQATPDEWFGGDTSDSPDTAIYVAQVQDKSSAREAIFAVGRQGEGPIGQAGVTHFDKFLRVYREHRAVAAQPQVPVFARNQASNPRTGIGGDATITDHMTLLWARLANVRYKMLLMDIVLAISVTQDGTAPSTTATRADFRGWAFREMRPCIKTLINELRQMALTQNAPSEAPTAGFPFELPTQSLPTTPLEQVQVLRGCAAESLQLRMEIQKSPNLTGNQKGVLQSIGDIDTAVKQKLG
jgi:hypothetical protein